MSEEIVREIAVKSVFMLLIAAGGTRLLRRKTAEARRLVWALAFLSLLALPLLVGRLPSFAVPPPIELPVPTRPLSSTGTPIRRTATGNASAPAMTEAPTSASGSWALWLGGIWAIGLTVGLVRSGHSLARVWGVARRGRLLESRSGVRLVRSSEIEVPLTFGVIRPVILLPEPSQNWSPERIETVLAHETAHIRRFDWVWMLAARAACTLYWPNPLVWWAESQLRAESESAADESVLRSGVSATCYAEDLVEIAAGAMGRHRPTGALAIAEETHLQARIRRILGSSAALPLSFRAMMTTAGFWSLAVVVIAGTRFVPGRDGSSDPIRLGPLPAASRVTDVKGRETELSDGSRLELIAITRKDRSWDREGRSLEKVEGARLFVDEAALAKEHPGTRFGYVRIRHTSGVPDAIGPVTDTAGHPLSAGVSGQNQSSDDVVHSVGLLLPAGGDEFSILISVAVGPEQPVRSVPAEVGAPREGSRKGDPTIAAVFVPLPLDYAGHENQYRFVPVDKEGRPVELESGTSPDSDGKRMVLYGLKATAKRVAKVEIRHREVQWVRFGHLPLVPRDVSGS